jgi:putative hemolysin
VDEYGGVSGVITLHDLLELLVGDLRDKEDVSEEEVEEIRPVSENVWEIAGSASLDEVRKALDCELEAEDCDTFGGYLFGNLGEIPDDGTTMELDVPELHVEILKVEDHRIVATRVTRVEAEEDDEDSDEKEKEKEKDKDK